jgi:type II secretory pathway component PulL
MGAVTLTRKHAVLFLALAAWNVFTWGTFAKNLAAAHASGEDRPTGYWVAHTVLIVVNLAIAVVVGRVGFQAWRATRSGDAVAKVDA